MRKKDGQIVSCEICKSKFYRPKNVIQKNKLHYCSKKCYAIARSKIYVKEKSGNWGGGLKEVQCNFCNKTIFIKPSRLKRSSAFFCSRKCLIEGTLKSFKGPTASNWQGGVSKEGYPFKFDTNLKEQIRERDNYICQNCSMTEEEHLIVIGCCLDIHHIDYNKENLNLTNLITLCRSCNVRANYNKDYWINFYNKKMEYSNENI